MTPPFPHCKLLARRRQSRKMKRPIARPNPARWSSGSDWNSTKLRQDSEANSAIHLALVIKEKPAPRENEGQGS